MSAILELPNAFAAPVHCPSVEAVASLNRVTKRFPNGVVALDNLSLTLRHGEVVALLGPNGAGKSTVVKLLMGLSSPTSGTVQIFGADPRNHAARLRTGVMLQVGRAPEMLRVREHIELFRGYYLDPMPLADLVEMAGLDCIQSRLFGQLSGGQKQRVLFALALAGNPDLIFLDEPTVGLDIKSRRSMWTQIELLAARGKTVLLTTHYLEEADSLSQRIVVIDKGRVVCEGTPAEVKSLGSIASGLAASGSAASGSPNTSSQSHQPVKIIRCSTALSTSVLLNIPGVTSATVRGGITTVVTTHSEATLRELLALDSSLHSIDVQSPRLEDAFLALTGDHNE